MYVLPCWNIKLHYWDLYMLCWHCVNEDKWLRFLLISWFVKHRRRYEPLLWNVCCLLLVLVNDFIFNRMHSFITRLLTYVAILTDATCTTVTTECVFGDKHFTRFIVIRTSLTLKFHPFLRLLSKPYLTVFIIIHTTVKMVSQPY